jgi:hypothetical protein
MTCYTFRIRRGSSSTDLAVDSPDDDAVWQEAAKVCSDLIRDTVAGLKDSPEWRLEVADEKGFIRHMFRLTAETFDRQGVSEPRALS